MKRIRMHSYIITGRNLTFSRQRKQLPTFLRIFMTFSMQSKHTNSSNLQKTWQNLNIHHYLDQRFEENLKDAILTNIRVFNKRNNDKRNETRSYREWIMSQVEFFDILSRGNDRMAIMDQCICPKKQEPIIKLISHENSRRSSFKGNNTWLGKRFGSFIKVEWN